MIIFSIHAHHYHHHIPLDLFAKNFFLLLYLWFVTCTLIMNIDVCQLHIGISKHSYTQLSKK